MVRKILTAVLASVVAVSLSFGAPKLVIPKAEAPKTEAPKLEITSWLKPGNVMVNVGLHYSYLGLGAGGGIEWIFAEIKVADILPFQFGVAARGFADLLPWYSYGMGFGVGGMVTGHFSIKSLKLGISFVDNVDFYIGLGAGLTIAPGFNNTYYGYWNPTGVNFWSSDGVSYFLSDNFALFAEYNYHGGWNQGGTLGVMLKI
ncbi:MAG: hypothetical protein HZC28_10165 [Spirochaetes bacterium]|nr:hypothetical protein [Spirochaetota bacterium]